MKFRHQAAILIAVPAIFQIVVVILLWQALIGLETAGQNETAAKQILAECQEIEGLLGTRILQITQDDPQGANPSGYAEKINESLKTLKKLVNESKEAKVIAERIEMNAKLFLTRFEELTDSYVEANDTILFARFLHQDEFFESTAAAVNHLRADIGELAKIYGPISQEFDPTSTRAREHFRNTVILTVASNLILILVLSILVNHHALNRLQRLMDNILSFAASGTAVRTKLGGNDELAEIDRLFSEVALERRRLDEIRKAMTAMVSHDLRTPLSSMILTLEIMTDTEQEKVEVQTLRKLERLRSEADRLRRLTNTLLDIEKLESGSIDVELEGVPIRRLVGTAFNTTLDLARSVQIELLSSIDGSLYVLCDEDRTVQVLVNLLSNAIKFSPPGSAIKVTSRKVHKFVRFEVIDSGPGIPPEKQNELFGKFIQLDQPEDIRKQGSGLGLYICKMLLAPQDGKIGFESPTGGGSCFWFQLPLYGEDTTQTPPVDPNLDD